MVFFDLTGEGHACSFYSSSSCCNATSCTRCQHYRIWHVVMILLSGCLESPKTRLSTLPSGGYSQRFCRLCCKKVQRVDFPPFGMQEALVRDTAVTALLELYADEDNVEPMHELTARFAPRFAQLIHDVDEGVAVKGVRQHPLQQPSSQHFHIQMHL